MSNKRCQLMKRVADGMIEVAYQLAHIASGTDVNIASIESIEEKREQEKQKEIEVEKLRKTNSEQLRLALWFARKHPEMGSADAVKFWMVRFGRAYRVQCDKKEKEGE